MADNQQDNSTDLAINKNETSTDLVISENQNSTENGSENSNETENNDEYIRITAAHQMLGEAQRYEEEGKDYPAALHLYRICVDFLLEELMFAEGTEQSRIYLREKCTAIMDRIDHLKTKLEPIPISTESLTTNLNSPVEQLESLQI